MRFKFLVVFVEDALTEAVAEAAKEAGATGCTRINSASGEGIEKAKTFFCTTTNPWCGPSRPHVYPRIGVHIGMN